MAFTASSGHPVSSAVLSGGGAFYDSGTVLSGGIALATLVVKKGDLIVSSGGLAAGVNVTGAGNLVVSAGGTASAVVTLGYSSYYYSDAPFALDGGLIRNMAMAGEGQLTVDAGGVVAGLDIFFSDAATTERPMSSTAAAPAASAWKMVGFWPSGWRPMAAQAASRCLAVARRRSMGMSAGSACPGRPRSASVAPRAT
jgi:hypothetical protein